MSNYEKEYIECRLIILGDKNTGKKSFINRLLNISSTSLIEDKEAELEYNKKIENIIKKAEDAYDYMNMIQEPESTDKKSKIFSKTTFSRTGNNESDINNAFFSGYKKGEINSKNFLKLLNIHPILTNHYQRPPIPEYPSLLFNVHKAKIIIKPYYILPGEELSYNFASLNEEDSDYELEKENKISVKGLKHDIRKILRARKTIIEDENLTGYKISIYNCFLLFYDMSNFSTFEKLKIYHKLIEKKFSINEEDNIITCIMGNKKDKKVSRTEEQQNSFNNFKNDNHLKLFEISIKPFYNFDKFFLDFVFQLLTPFEKKLFEEDNFKNDFEKITCNKSTFSKAIREIVDPTIRFPGPEYNLNLYGYNSTKEMLDSFKDKKKRFNNKIFSNKQGPIFKSKSTKDMSVRERAEKMIPFIIQTRGGLLDKPIEGYSLGITKGKLNLVKTRKEIILKRNESLKEQMRGEFQLCSQSKEKKSKDESYFEEVIQRKKIIESKKSNKRQFKINNLLKVNKYNLKSIEEKREIKKNKILTHLNFNKSSSTSNILRNSLTEENSEEKIFYRQRFCESVFPNNKKYVEKYNAKRSQIVRNRIIPITPGPNAYDIRGNIYDPNKGPFILGKWKKIKYERPDPSYPDFKDEFEKIVERAEKYGKDGIKKSFKPRFQKIVKEKDPGPYIDKKIWERWNKNKENIEKEGEIKKFFDKRKQKLEEHYEHLKRLKKENLKVQELKNEISIKKGYGDLYAFKDINYSLVEDASPKYSLKSRHIPKIVNNEEIGSVLVGDNIESLENIKNEQLNRPLPDIKYVRPKLPNIKIGKEERFKNTTKAYEGSIDLFVDGIFAPKTQEGFSKLEAFSGLAQRFLSRNAKSPSPAEYKIKSSFEIIAEQGKKISDNKKRIKIKEELSKQNKTFFDNSQTNNKAIQKEKILKLDTNNSDGNIP